MRKAYIIGVLLLAILFVFGACTPTPESPPAEPTPAATPPPELPLGMGAFQGSVMWGDKPVARAGVVADTKLSTLPDIIGPGQDYPKYEQFETRTDEGGSYFLLVEPGEYCLYCQLPWSDYTYEYLAGFAIFPMRHEVAGGEIISVDLKALDWSIELISPGESDFDTERMISENPPTLVWKEPDWLTNENSEAYDYHQVIGYYQVGLSAVGDDGYHTVLKERANDTSYIVQSILEGGKYRWEVRAFTQTGKEIAGTTGEFYFLVP